MNIDLESCFVGFLIGVAIYLLLNCVFNIEGLDPGQSPSQSLTPAQSLTPEQEQASLQRIIDKCMREINWDWQEYDPVAVAAEPPTPTPPTPSVPTPTPTPTPFFTKYTTFDFGVLSLEEFNYFKTLLSSNTDNTERFLSLKDKSAFLDMDGLTLSQVVKLVNCFQENIQGLMFSIVVDVGDDVDNLSAINSLNNPVNLEWLYIDTKSGTVGDLTDLNRFTNLVSLELNDLNITGDISSLSNLTELQYLQITGDSLSGSLTGDIVNIQNLTKLRHLNLSNTSVTGDIQGLSNLPELTSLNLSNTSVTGDIKFLDSFKALDRDYIAVCPSNIYGNINNSIFATDQYEKPSQPMEYWLTACPDINAGGPRFNKLNF